MTLHAAEEAVSMRDAWRGAGLFAAASVTTIAALVVFGFGYQHGYADAASDLRPLPAELAGAPHRIDYWPSTATQMLSPPLRPQSTKTKP